MPKIAPMGAVYSSCHGARASGISFSKNRFAPEMRLAHRRQMDANPYQKLLDRGREISLLRSASQVLEWDEQTYLPAKGVEYRAEQLSYFGARAHALFTDPVVGEWLESSRQAGFAPESDEGVNIREWSRSYERATKLPVTFVEEFEKTAALSREAWKHARQAGDFSAFQPHLQKIVSMTIEKAQRYGFTTSPYDALLEDYEPGATAAYVAPVFAELKPALKELVQQIGNPSAGESLIGNYPIANQQAFNRIVAEAFGYDFAAGRIDTTTHPFATSLGPFDHRITTRYDEKLFQTSLYGILHETGHALYEQGLRPEAFGTPVGSAVSLGLHESQSRLWENHVGRSRSFWERWYPVASEHFTDLKRFGIDQIVHGIQKVAPSFIRVEADEVTYDLHVLLRFEIELGLIEGKIAVRDLPEIWNAKFEDLFGLKVSNDRIGVLQDIHWSMGALGYFPTYSLGNLNAAQLMNFAEQHVAGLTDSLAKGEYQPLLTWLRTEVHRPGKKFLPNDLMARVTGEPTQAKYRIEYLRRKYLG
jgi:carboxypeptidase Taq